MAETGPYYTIGQWRLPTRRTLRAFLSSADGKLYFTRVPFDPDHLTPDEAHYCETRVVPRLVQRCQELSREHPGMLKSSLVRSDLLQRLHQSADATGLASPDPTPATHRATSAPAGAGLPGHGRLLGALLVEDDVITAPQLQEALAIQAASPRYVPLGHVLVGMKVLTRKRLTALLDRHQKRSRLGQILVKAGCLTAAQLEAALVQQKNTRVRLGQALIELGYLSEATMREALCMQLHVNFFDLDRMRIDPRLGSLLPEPFATRHLVVPLFRVGDVLVIAMDDPSNAALVEQLQFALRLPIEVVTSTTSRLHGALRRLYGRAPQTDNKHGGWPYLLVGAVHDPFVAELAANRPAF